MCRIIQHGNRRAFSYTVWLTHSSSAEYLPQYNMTYIPAAVIVFDRNAHSVYSYEQPNCSVIMLCYMSIYLELLPTRKCVLFSFEKRYYFSSFLAVVSEFGPPYYLIIIIIIIRSREPPTRSEDPSRTRRRHKGIVYAYYYHTITTTKVYTCRTVRLYCIVYRRR